MGDLIVRDHCTSSTHPEASPKPQSPRPHSSLALRQAWPQVGCRRGSESMASMAAARRQVGKREETVFGNERRARSPASAASRFCSEMKTSKAIAQILQRDEDEQSHRTRETTWLWSRVGAGARLPVPCFLPANPTGPLRGRAPVRLGLSCVAASRLQCRDKQRRRTPRRRAWTRGAAATRAGDRRRCLHGPRALGRCSPPPWPPCAPPPPPGGIRGGGLYSVTSLRKITMRVTVYTKHQLTLQEP